MSHRSGDREVEYGNRILPEDDSGQHGPSTAETAMITPEENATTAQKDQLIINILEVQFPPPGLEWLRDFERSPDTPLKKSYRSGILQAKVDTSAPIIKVGITFLAGADKPSVIKAEMSKVSDEEPFQKSPEWRVFTAATLLNRFEVGDDLLIHHRDASATIFQKSKQRKRISNTKSPENEDVLSQSSQGAQHTADQVREQSQEVVKRNIQDHTLTIDSGQVKLLHGIVGANHNFDIVATLVEIDMFSMRDLMMNFRTVVQSGGRNVSAKDIVAILDTMINDVRRLCTRSPRLFRMSTRALITHSVDTRYGVDYGTNFATLTTSTGIRKLIEKSSQYYLSLNENTDDQQYIRPKFLQMLVLLLSFLNNEDLKDIAKVLNSTFHIPADRANLELLIMKVLPLSSINSEVFLEGLYEVYKPAVDRPRNYGYSVQAKIWADLQKDLAAKGYILPVHIESSGPESLHSDSNIMTANLEDLLAQMELEDSEPSLLDFRRQSRSPGPQRTGSWRAPWPRDGVIMSTIFKHLQHVGLLREKGNSEQGTVWAMNDIPHLEITAEDHDNKLQAWFTNKKLYRLKADDPDLISDMKEGTYVLTSLDSDESPNLVIDSKVLNKPFLDGTKELNILVQKIRGYFGGQFQRQGAFTRVLQRNGPSVTPFAEIYEPTEAKWLWAEIVPPIGDRQRVAEVFKMGNKVVYRDDILRDMNSSLSQIDKAVERLEKELGKFTVKKGTDENSKRQQQEVIKCTERIENIRRFMSEADNKRKELQKIQRHYPEDPITKVIYPSFAQTNGEKREFQSYKTEPKAGGDHLIIMSKKLTVESVYPSDDHVIELAFVNSGLKLFVEPLTSTSTSDSGPSLTPGNTLLWFGYYVALVEPCQGVKHGQSILGYFRVRSQQLDSFPAGGRSGDPSLKNVISVLV